MRNREENPAPRRHPQLPGVAAGLPGLLVADRHGRVREHRRPPFASRQPHTPDGEELRASADLDGRVPPADSTTPAADATDTGAAWLLSDTSLAPRCPLFGGAAARRSPDG